MSIKNKKESQICPSAEGKNFHTVHALLVLFFYNINAFRRPLCAKKNLHPTFCNQRRGRNAPADLCKRQPRYHGQSALSKRNFYDYKEIIVSKNRFSTIKRADMERFFISVLCRAIIFILHNKKLCFSPS